MSLIFNQVLLIAICICFILARSCPLESTVVVSTFADLELVVSCGDVTDIGINGTIDVERELHISGMVLNIYGFNDANLVAYSSRIFNIDLSSTIFFTSIRLEGGVIENDNGGSIVIFDSHIELLDVMIVTSLSKHGGALYSTNSSVVLNGVVIMDGIASTFGGAIYIEYCTAPLNIFNSTIINNGALSGGGIYTVSCDVKIENSTLTQNSAVESGGCVHTVDSNLIFTHSTMSKCAIIADPKSGGTSGLGGGIYCLQSDIKVLDSQMTECVAVTGILVYASSSTVELISSKLNENYGLRSVISISGFQSTLTIEDSIMTRNRYGTVLYGRY